MTGAAEKRSSFALAFLMLAPAKREALRGVYAYCRLIDDIVDSGALRKEEARRMLSFWREEIGRTYAGHPTHSLAQRLRASIEAFALPQEAFLEVIRGCEMDLEKTRYETFSELESYLQGVACAVGRLCVRIFGAAHTPDERAREFARLFGYAFQLTNIIRDVGADLELGRIYLPAEDLRSVGYSYEALIHRDHNGAFTRLMELEYERAKACYRRGRAILDFRDRPAMLAAEVMAHVYEGLLDQIKETGFRVLFTPPRQPLWRKAKLAVRAWLYCQGVHL